MAQSEDVELRDLVINALEKNGSLAKIRALLRANIFLAFEEDCKNANPVLDNLLQIPEGLLSLSLVHEFFEYCNLRNTMFVYVSESRQGKEYKYEGRKRLAERLGSLKRELPNEPLLVTIIKSILTSQSQQDSRLKAKFSSLYKNGMKDDENNSYIVHEDSSNVSSQSQSQSDNSSDEKNNSMLRIPIDNSDTDTSSDSTRDKTSSEYIANENIIVNEDSDDGSKKSLNVSPSYTANTNNINNNTKHEIKISFSCNDQPDLLNAHISSESSSYLELQASKIILNKTVDVVDSSILNDKTFNKSIQTNRKSLLPEIELKSPRNENKSATPSTVSSVRQDDFTNRNITEQNINLDKDIVTSDYSYDFSISAHSSQNNSNKESPMNDYNMNGSNFDNESPKHDLQSSRSSVSISDVADLLDLDSSIKQLKENKKDKINSTVNSGNKYLTEGKRKQSREDSDDFSVSSIPSLSNLSLDFHSE